MIERLDNARVLMYSHDSFGLGHLRRCRAIAHALVDRFKGINVLILSGSPIIGRFEFRARVDFVRVPGIIKLRNGAYTALSRHVDLDATLAMRESIIRHTAEDYDPHVFIVDKEPLGIRGEVATALACLKARGTRNVLGLREIMDESGRLRREWCRKRAWQALETLYDELWVFGIPAMGDPLREAAAAQAICDKQLFTGYLQRDTPSAVSADPPAPFAEPFVLVTAGGGGDGLDMIDWVLRAYEQCADLPYAALIVAGPFMAVAERQALRTRARRLPRVKLITFDAHIETLMEQAAGVVAMSGYNTFCEILSFDKRALLVPRREPRLEQWLRAGRAAGLGLARMMEPNNARDTGAMIDALRALPGQSLPSAAGIAHLLGGLDVVGDRIKAIMDSALDARPSSAA